MSENILYCPECRSEYREGFSTCSDCNVPLVRRLDSETSDYLVPLAREQSFEFVAELLDRLEKQDIPYVIEAGTALELLDNESADAVKPEPWEARVWIAHSREEQAERVLEEFTAEWQSDERNRPFRRPLEWQASRSSESDPDDE